MQNRAVSAGVTIAIIVVFNVLSYVFHWGWIIY